MLRVKAVLVRVALAGRIGATCLRNDGSRITRPAWHSATLCEGDQLQLGPAECGCAYLAVAGGPQMELQLSSSSSYWRAGLACLLGRDFRPGDELPCGAWSHGDPSEWRSHTALWTKPRCTNPS